MVIIGAGFGGLYAARLLGRAPVQLTVIDRRNFHLFQPLLYQVASGALSPGEIASPIRYVLNDHKNTSVLLAEASGIEPDRRVVSLNIGGEVPYDYLIVAAGARNFYFGHDEWEHFAPGLKTIEDATAIRHRLLFAFEAAEREPDPEKRREWLTFLIVGAGPTGVELAGALSEIANDTLRGDFRTIRPEEARILLLDGAPRVLSTCPEDLSHAAERSLVRLGVRPRNGVQVTSIDAFGADLEGPNGRERINARTIVWAAGVRASPLGEVLAQRLGAKLDKSGRVIVEPDCSVAGHPEVFVIGDLANFSQDGKPLPGVAPVAMQQGRYVAKVIGNRARGIQQQEPFHYFDKGSLAVIGRAAAVAQFGRYHFHGFFAWLLWLFVHLMYLVEFSNRLLVFIEWGFLYITFNRGARLITGEGRSADRKT